MDVASSESSPVSYETGSSNGSAARSDSVSVSGSISGRGSAKVGSIGHVRKKKWSPKVKTGCVTCRSRRIKCDEAKPSCKKCTTSGRQCEGYENPTKSTSGIQPMLPKGDELSTLLVQPNHAIAPSEVDPTPSERRMMYMFRTEAALQMAGAFNQTLWTIDLLQVTQMYPVVWHAGIALAAAYWRYNTPSEIDPSEQTKIELTKLALHQYNKAIRYAIQLAAKESPSQADQEVLLISNLMFTGICSLCGNIKNALEQFCQGLRLFNSFRLWEKIDSNQTNPHSSPLCRESLVTAFRRFAGQSISLREPNWPEWQTRQLLPEIKPTTPFALPTEAYLEFEDIHNSLLDAAMARIYAHNKDMPQPQQDISAIFRNALEAWKARFKYLSESEPLNPTDLEAIIILKMRLLSLEVTLRSGFSKMEMMWDMHNAKFAKIVALGERLCHIRGIKNESASASQPALFSFTASICEPLYQTARFCRHSSTRHRALNILRRIPMNEGIFTTTILADVAEAVINIEEGAVAAGLPSSNCDCVVADRICEDHRVSDCHMTFPNHQEGHIRLRTNGEVTHRLPVRTVYLQC